MPLSSNWRMTFWVCGRNEVRDGVIVVWRDYFDFWNCARAFARGVASIEKNWRLWDRGYWTRYDLHPTNRLASRMYQKVHVRLMRLLGFRTARPLFYRTARRWQTMLYDPWCNALWLAVKSREKFRLRGYGR